MEISCGIPKELSCALEALNVKNVGNPTWTLKCADKGVFVTLQWILFKSPAIIAQPASATPTSARGVNCGHNAQKVVTRKPVKRKSPSRQKRDKLRLEMFQKKKAADRKSPSVTSGNSSSLPNDFQAAVNTSNNSLLTEPGNPALMSVGLPVEAPQVTPLEAQQVSSVEAPRVPPVEAPQVHDVNSELDSDAEPDNNLMNDDELYEWGCFYHTRFHQCY